ncbi:MAG TPA: rhomboid family intramembrane serine protease [Bdellovibrionota bacterium]|nr:rhomboid family intramembrane serine protease [Bdellovibrionota bacterium]
MDRFCPSCRKELTPWLLDKGAEDRGAYRCVSCKGVLLTEHGLRKLAEPELMVMIDEVVRICVPAPGRACVTCSQEMLKLDLRERRIREKPWLPERRVGAEKAGSVELCKGCGLFWLDRDTAARLPPPRRLGGRREPRGGPEDPLESLLAGQGLPIVVNAPATRVQPVLTYFAIGIAVASGILARIAPGWSEDLALVLRLADGEPAPHRWLRFLTFAWIPDGAGSAAVDLYFLALFGRAIEGELGRLKYALLYVLSCILGGYFHLAIAPGLPVFGLGAWVAAITWCYCLAFPGVRIGVKGAFGRLHGLEGWTRLPPAAWLLFWIGFQTVDWVLAADLERVSQPAVAADLGLWAGGLVAGTIAWLALKLRSSR